MDTANQVTEFALTKLSTILNRSGYVLYSDAKSLRRNAVYLLGHNPGGSPDDQPTNTVRASLEAMPTKNINNYLDEAWDVGGRSYEMGQAPLQRRVVWLLQELGLKPRDVPASNLIFVRSVDVSGSMFGELADLCWEVHEMILKIVRPQLLIVFGISSPSPYTYLYEKFGPNSEETIESGHGNWRCRAFTSDGGMAVIGLPHLSRYKIIGKTAVISWIRKFGAL